MPKPSAKSPSKSVAGVWSIVTCRAIEPIPGTPGPSGSTASSTIATTRLSQYAGRIRAARRRA